MPVPDPSLSQIPKPPPKDAAPNAANVQALEKWFNSIIAFRSLTTTRPWIFYEELDRYLGPWEEQGYPIAYGKKYCILFSQDVPLNSDPAGAAWVRRTLILLQESIRDYVLKRFRDGSLKYMTPFELREAAFNSHPVAYTEGGLIMVSMLSTRLIPHIVSIPLAEFNPLKRTFIPTVVQTIVTGGILIPEGVAYMLQFAAGPAHTGVLQGAMRADSARLQNEMRLGGALVQTKEALDAARLDNVGLLDRLRDTLMRTEWPASDLGRLAEDVMRAIGARRSLVIQRYRREVTLDKRLLDVFKQFDRTAF